jgi:hypothetical protein
MSTVFAFKKNLRIEPPSESNNPKEEDFINDYFNQKERKIRDKYIEVKKSFQDNWEHGENENAIVQKYEKLEISKTNEEDNNMEKNENLEKSITNEEDNNTEKNENPNRCEDDKKENIKKNIPKNKKGNIKKNKSPGWEYTFNDGGFNQAQYKYTVIDQFVTYFKHNDEKDEKDETDDDFTLIKEFVFNKNDDVTLFMITLEITMQKMAYEILEANDEVIVPKIKNYYKVKPDKYTYRIIIQMEYISHEDLKATKVETAKKALEELRNHNIYHFDTHKDNIVQSVECNKVQSAKRNKVVLLDFGKAQIRKNPDISSTTGLYNNDFDYDKWIKRTAISSDNRLNPNFYWYGGKKNKSKRKTKKGKKKGKSKKTKKRTYRKRK